MATATDCGGGLCRTVGSACDACLEADARTRCGIHGDPTPNDSCPTCDHAVTAEGLAAGLSTAAAMLQPGQRFAAYSGLACTVERVHRAPEPGRRRVWFVVDATGGLPGYREVPATHLFPTTDEPF